MAFQYGSGGPSGYGFGAGDFSSSGDITAPTLTGAIAISGLTSTGYTATCPAATDDVGVVGYQYQLDIGGWTAIPGGSRSITLAGRTPGATDALEMRAFDAAGNTSGALSAFVTLASAGGGSVSGSVAGIAAYTISATGAVSGAVTDAAAATEPVTLAEAKLAARISGTSDFDAMIPGLISAARQMAEQETGREMVRKVRRQTFDSWPDPGVVLPVNGAASVAISYWDGAAWTALDGAAFVFFELGTGTGIAPAIGTAWPALGAVAGGARVRVDITAGPVDPTTADACVKVYIKALVGWWIDNPGAVAQGNMQPAPYLRNLLDPVRLWA